MLLNYKFEKGYISWKKSKWGGWRMSSADNTWKRNVFTISSMLWMLEFLKLINYLQNDREADGGKYEMEIVISLFYSIFSDV